MIYVYTCALRFKRISVTEGRHKVPPVLKHGMGFWLID